MNGMLHHDHARIVVERVQQEARRRAEAHRLAAPTRAGGTSADERTSRRRRAVGVRATVLRGKAGLTAVVAPLTGLAAALLGRAGSG
jgi:hypothetical protein